MRLRLIAGLGVAVGLAGCTPAVPMIAAAGGAGVASAQERGLGGTLSDAGIQVGVNERWFSHSVDMHRMVALSVHQGRVLVAGVVPTETMRADAIRLAREVPGVTQVIDEIVVDPAGITAEQVARDTWIGTELRARLIGDKQINALNVNLEVERGTVYLLGNARNRAELQLIIDHARNIAHVRRVISHIEVLGAPAPPPVITGVTAGPAEAPSAPAETQPPVFLAPEPLAPRPLESPSPQAGLPPSPQGGLPLVPLPDQPALPPPPAPLEAPIPLGPPTR